MIWIACGLVVAGALIGFPTFILALVIEKKELFMTYNPSSGGMTITFRSQKDEPTGPKEVKP